MININKLLADGYDVTEIDDGIFMVHDFIDEEDRKYIYDFAESLTDEQWEYSYMHNLKETSKNTFGTDDLDQLVRDRKVIINKTLIDKSVSLSPGQFPDGIDKRVEDTLWKYSTTFSNKLKKFVDKYPIRPFGVIQRHYAGTGLDEHVDQKNDPNLKFACIIYLNENYVDGELYFVAQNIRLRPPARSLVIFDASDKYLHGVDIVGEGPTRYVMTSFIWDNGVE